MSTLGDTSSPAETARPAPPITPTQPQQAAVTIGLLWHSASSGNLGVGALTASHLAVIDGVVRDLGVRARFKILGWRDRDRQYVQRPDLEVLAMRGRDVVRPSGLYASVRQCDVVLDISAGDSFADIYGIRRFAFNAIAKLVVLAAGRPLLLSPQTIGPFQRRWTRFLAGRLMRRAEVVVTRDSLSTEFLRPFNLGSKLVESTDVAFRLPYDRPGGRRDGPVRIGLNVSGLLFNGGYTRDNMFALKVDYPALVRSIIRHFGAVPGCEVHLVAHVNGHPNGVEDDHGVAVQLASAYPGVIVAPRFESPSEAKSYIAGLDFFCGSRMHACIAALSSGVPVLPIAYSRKFAGVFNALGYTMVADCRTQSEEEILDLVLQAFDRRGELKEMVQAGQERAETKLAAYEAVLHECLTKVAVKR